MRDLNRTVFKVRLTKRGRDIWFLFRLVCAGVVFLATLAALQVHVCRLEHPSKSILQCVAPKVVEP